MTTIRVAMVREKSGKNKNFSRSGKSQGILQKVNEKSGNLSFSSTKRSLQRCRSTTKMNLLPTTHTKVLNLSYIDALERSRSIPNCGKFSKCCLYFPMVSHVLKEGSLIIKTS